MSSRQGSKPTGREKFLAQRARLRESLLTTRANDTASRFNRLGDTQKKAIILLANEATQYFKNLPLLTHSHLSMTFEQFNDQDKASLMLGIKRLAELAAALPWEFADHAAPRNEIQTLRDSSPAQESAIN